MFVNRQHLRSIIFTIFSIGIIGISLGLTYFISFYNENVVDNELSKIENDLDCNMNVTWAYITLACKVAVAFCAGGILSDFKWIKLGTA